MVEWIAWYLWNSKDNSKFDYKAFLDFTHSSDCHKLDAMIKNSIEDKKPFTIEYLIVTPAKKEKPLQLKERYLLIFMANQLVC